MVHALKHIAIRLWLTILIGSLAALAGLQALQMPLGLEWAFALAAPVFVAVFYTIGWLFNRFGLNLVQRFINEASVWERAGKTPRAEKLLRKAVAVFDSFLISPFNKERRARGLTGHMARFYLTQAEISHEAEDIIMAYLKIQPEDHAVAEAWLQRFENKNRDPKEIEGLLSTLGKSQSDNPTIQTLIARLYLSDGRTDFQALQTYRRFLENNETPDEPMITHMAELFFKKRRIDVWALQAYITAYKLDRKRRHLIQGIAACLQGAQADGTDSASMKEARALLSKIDETTLKKIVAGFKPTAPPARKPAISPKTSLVKTLASATIGTARALTTGITSAVTTSTAMLTMAYRRLRGYPKLKPILGWTAVGLAGAGLVILVINTASYLIQSRPPEPEKIETPPTVVITDPYTLQVAAYLKIEHAEEYVAQLKSLGLDAFWTKAQGAKSKWYQVRLSHFADKASARAYGDTLKAKGIIDDFYVANYQRP
jgi:tetratricopeptide (TPR) repeat protein